MKVKFILQSANQPLDAFEEEVADFLNTIEIINISYFVSRESIKHLVFTYLSVMIVYKEKPDHE